MKAVLISICPEWCERIANAKKTIEVRKTKPKLPVPFKAYIYCTKGKPPYLQSRNNMFFYLEDKDTIGGHGPGLYKRLNGKVIGEFVCDEIYPIKVYSTCAVKNWHFLELSRSCLSLDEVAAYIGINKTGYGWHISDLKIYEHPKELYEFYRKCEKQKCEACEHLKYQRVNPSEYDYDCEYIGGHIPITRPPQSWCYVEEVRE